MQRRFLRKRGAAGKFLAGFQWAELPQSKPDGFASSLWEGAFGMAVQFLIASDTLATGLTACALSVKAYGFARFPLLSLRDIFPRPGEVGPQGDAFGLCRKLCRHP